MMTRRDMSRAGFRRALENQEFKVAPGGLPWYCSTREGTDKTVRYGASVGGERLYYRETVRGLCAMRTRHEKKRSVIVGA